MHRSPNREKRNCFAGSGLAMLLRDKQRRYAERPDAAKK
jgi:hypothetical protein